MPNVFIFHGTGGSPEGNWFPWLKEELEKLGCRVFVPKFPTPEGQSLGRWLRAFKPYERYLNEVVGVVAGVLGFLKGLAQERHDMDEVLNRESLALDTLAQHQGEVAWVVSGLRGFNQHGGDSSKVPSREYLAFEACAQRHGEVAGLVAGLVGLYEGLVDEVDVFTGVFLFLKGFGKTGVYSTDGVEVPFSLLLLLARHENKRDPDCFF